MSPARASAWGFLPRRLAVAGMAVGLVGLTLVGVRWQSTTAYEWRPLQVALPSHPDEQPLEVQFTPSQSQVHELGIEFGEVLPKARLFELLGGTGEDLGISMRWRVSDGERLVASGDAGRSVYVSIGGASALGRIRRHLLDIPFHRDRPSITRMVGRVRLEVGRDYRIEVHLDRLDPALENARPVLVLQLAREIWTHRTQRTLAAGHAGIGLCAVALALLMAAAGLRLAGRPGRA